MFFMNVISCRFKVSWLDLVYKPRMGVCADAVVCQVLQSQTWHPSEGIFEDPQWPTGQTDLHVGLCGEAADRFEDISIISLELVESVDAKKDRDIDPSLCQKTNKGIQ